MPTRVLTGGFVSALCLGDIPHKREGIGNYDNLSYDLFGCAWVNEFDPPAGRPFAKLGGVAIAGSIVRNQPVDAFPRILTGGAVQWSNVDVLYNRVHVSPVRIDVGNILTAQIYDVYVWNANFTRKLLSAVTPTGTTGMTLQEPTPAPTYFGANEERHYTLAVGTNGPATIGADILFDFTGTNDPRLYITGQRVVVWIFPPLADYKEMLEWKTDVIQAFSGEQRIALRRAPRQKFEHAYSLDHEQIAELRLKLFQWAQELHAIPIWNERTYLGTVNAGATYIIFNPAQADYRAGGMLVLWNKDTYDYEAVEIATILSDRITFARPVPRTMANVSVAPLRYARTLSGVQFKRGDAPGHAIASASFAVDDNANLTAAGSLTQYRGVDVLLNPHMVVEGISESISRFIDVFDNDAAPIEVDVVTGYCTNMMMATFLAQTKAERWALRQFLYKKRGRWGLFWLPTYNADIEMASTYISNALNVSIWSIGLSRFFRVIDVMIELTDRTKYFRSITACVEGLNGKETITIDSGIARTILPSEIYRISFLHLVRFDSDEITMNHQGDSGNIVTISAPVREVPA